MKKRSKDKTSRYSNTYEDDSSSDGFGSSEDLSSEESEDGSSESESDSVNVKHRKMKVKTLNSKNDFFCLIRKL